MDHPGVRLDEARVVGVVRAIGMAAVVGEPRRRVIVALTELCRVLACDLITAAQSRIDPATGQTHFEEMLLCGELASEREDRVLAYLASDHSADPFYAAFGVATARVMTDRPETEVVVFRREDLVGDGAWYASEHYRTTRSPIGIDAAMYAGLPTRQRGVWIGAGFHRRCGGPAFTDAERDLVRIFLLGARPLFEAFHASGKSAGPFLATFNARQRELIYALLGGYTSKEIAARTGLAPSSVNTYVKRLYREMGVSGRGELVRLCNERGVFLSGSTGTGSPSGPPSR
jgi:DNA-binding CsgD family transcriptional regulator